MAMANEKRLIDAKALWHKIGYITGVCASPQSAFNNILAAIYFAPTVDAVEVEHGQWEKASEKMPIYRCSICRERNLFKNGDNVFSNYCPSCGAKMDGGAGV